MVAQRYFNTRQAAAYLGMGDGQPAVEALYQMVHRRQVPVTRIGRRLRFDRLALDAALADAAVKGGPCRA